MPVPSPLVRAAETLLDKSLVLGYSSIGWYARQPWLPPSPAPGSLAGRTVIVTGASSGLGRATAAGVAQLGARVRLIGRTASRLEEAARAIHRSLPNADLVIDECDMSDLDAVRSWCLTVEESIHAVVHSAGVMPPERSESAQGHELALATHVLGPVLMDDLLQPRLHEDGDARIVWMSSGGMYSAPLTEELVADPEYRRGEYNGTRAYARTKRLQVVAAQREAELMGADGIVVHAMHPGWADTPGITDSLPGFAAVVKPILRTAEQGADTAVWLVAAPEAAWATGDFWQDRRPRPTDFLPWHHTSWDLTDRVWRYCRSAAGLDS
ncbi:SDR family NAD(P)-dependent oxidoreductase [Aeromicrobium piscarium]|uniref:SDR family NAD(P)-dependent oxidoreductase n=1 Tax=Aeromicrobium piscarium TaxID=2590901 RepID=A0A554SP83_9ACTN|nr:SDR family NAD(P)-dependent oxidoreductase [Aeromicrobium piscarium]TSD68164.1 SDR family NAD(P)-dependent oxidoreductase [Aeromicrobium piscarium]